LNSINANLPVMNMPQASNQQSEVVRAPAVHQVQNADLARDRIDLQVRTAREAEQAEGKIVDPDDKRDEEQHRGRKGQGDEENGEDGGVENPENAAAVTMTDSGQLVDLEA